MGLINLTPIGDGWTMKDRIVEIVFQSLALVFVTPLVYAHACTEKIMEKILP